MQPELTQSIKVVVGADGVFDSGWLPADKDSLDLLKPDGWEHRFSANSIDASDTQNANGGETYSGTTCNTSFSKTVHRKVYIERER